MIDHFGIVCGDYEKSKEFYDAVLQALGYTRQMDVGAALGYGRDRKPDFWLEDAAGRSPGAPIHFAFRAEGTDAVTAFYDAALKLGRSRCMHLESGPSTTPGTSARSCGTPTGTTSKPCSTRRRRVSPG